MAPERPGTSERERPGDTGAITEASARAPFLQVDGIYKSFGSALVLKDVSLSFIAGEIHSVVGENGAGKSTLAKILAGVESPDRGRLFFEGASAHMSTPIEAQRLGVTMIFQEPTLFPDLSVAENIFVGRQSRRRGRPWLDKRETLARTDELLKAIGSFVPRDRRLLDLSVPQMQMVEIASAMSRDTRLLIVDEPTASLTPSETEKLFRLLRSLCARGTAVLFIGHRLEEVFEISDRLTVLRDGEVVDSRQSGGFTTFELIQAMVGRPIEQARVEKKAKEGLGKPLLELHGLSRSGVFKDINLQVTEGEIVGMAGLVGAGRSEIAQAAFGLDRYGTGEVKVCGTRLRPGRPDMAIAAGLAYVPEDRKSQGLADRLPIYQNMTLLASAVRRGFAWIHPYKEKRLAQTLLADLDVRARNISQPVGQLSGGNQQKVVLAKWLATKPRVLILDEPTRGVDVGAKGEIHAIMRRLAGEGLGILLISSDLPEVLALSTRIVVIREGRLAGELPGDASASDVMRLVVPLGVAASAS